jgi:hypothetical protein
MHLFDAATRFYGGNAIVGGGLPLAVGLALADKMQGRRGHRLLLRRRRGGRGRVPRVDEPRRALAAAGALLLREQPLRDGHGARAPPGADRPRAQGGELRHAGLAGRRHGRARGRGGRRAAALSACGRAAARCSSSSGPTASAPTRCTTPSSTATKAEVERVEGARPDSRVDPAAGERGAPDDERRRAIEAEVAQEVDEAVAFAESGTLGAGRGADAGSSTRDADRRPRRRSGRRR